jgi:hypothetical protein
MMKKKMMKKSLLLALCLFSCGASAEVYKCLQDGKVTISTLPCPPGASSTVVPLEVLPQGGAMTPEEEVAQIKLRADTLERERLAQPAPRAFVLETPPPATTTGIAPYERDVLYENWPVTYDYDFRQRRDKRPRGENPVQSGSYIPTLGNIPATGSAAPDRHRRPSGKLQSGTYIPANTNNQTNNHTNSHVNKHQSHGNGFTVERDESSHRTRQGR